MNLEQMGEEGVKYYNSLREFYDLHDRMDLLLYVIDYSLFEAEQRGVAFDKMVRKVGYETVKSLYERNIENLRQGREVPVPLELTLKKFLLELRKEGANEP